MLLFLWSLLSVSSAHLCEKGQVVELDATTFDAAISDCPNILVDFYAPWCSHCNALNPQLELAATELTELTLAKINADKFTAIASKYNIKSYFSEYPTLKLFVDGVSTDYKGPHRADLLVAHLRRMLAPTLSSLSSPSAVKEFVVRAGDKLPIFIGFGVDAASLTELAHQHKLKAWFATVDRQSSELLSSEYGVAALPALLVQHLSLDERAVFEGPFQDKDALALFVRRNLLPRVTDLTYDNMELVKTDGRPIVLAIARGDDVQKRMKEVASVNPDLLFAVLHPSSYIADNFLSSKLLVWDGNTNFYTRSDVEEPKDEVEVAETIQALVEDFKSNKVKKNGIRQPSLMEQLTGFIGQNVLYIIIFFVTIVVFLQGMDWMQPGPSRT